MTLLELSDETLHFRVQQLLAECVALTGDAASSRGPLSSSSAPSTACSRATTPSAATIGFCEHRRKVLGFEPAKAC